MSVKWVDKKCSEQKKLISYHGKVGLSPLHKDFSVYLKETHGMINQVIYHFDYCSLQLPSTCVQLFFFSSTIASDRLHILRYFVCHIGSGGANKPRLHAIFSFLWNRCIVLYLQIFNSQNYVLFKISASSLLFQCSYDFANF